MNCWITLILQDIDRIREFPNQSHPSFHVRDKRLKEQAQRDVHSLGGPKQASRPPSPSSPFTECSDWPSVFRETPKIETLKILSRNKDGTLSTPAPEALIAWRMAFDTANLSRIYCLRIDALPVSHLLQLRWSGMEAFGKASWQAQRTWSKIKLLDVTISDPPKNAQPRIMRQHMKVLYSWLSSFADSLEELRFEWRERRGPNPMTLPQLRRVQLQMPVVQWKKLRTYSFNGEMVPF